ncbi:MAG: hypothetical protein MI923_10265 [Phycisphaerales bacterium]|nr:hypothetical protein [Phycisphaerales bacterium]
MTKRTKRHWLELTLGITLALAMGMTGDCDMPADPDMMPDDPMDNPDDGNPPALNIVKTDIDVHVGARVAAGDGIIAYGTGGFSGVDYIEVGDTAGRGVPNGANFLAKSFAVCGKKIIFIENFLLTVFDTTDQSSSAIAMTDVRLTTVPAGLDGGGHIQCDGNFVATRNDANIVTDGKQVKVVDVSNAVPNVVSFDVNPAAAPEQVAVDASNPHVAAVANDIIYVYDINDPTAAPQQFDLSGNDGINNDTQIQFKNGIIFYKDNSTFGNAKLLDTSDGSIVTLDENPSAQTLGLNGGTYAYFLDRDNGDSFGTVNRSGVGDVPNAASTIAGDDRVTDGTDNNGFVGWAQTVAITPDGDMVFMAGSESIGQQEWLMLSNGGSFNVLPDPDDATADGLKASDVSTSANTVGFKQGVNETTKLGYIDLE